MNKIVGIDLGTTNSLVATVESGIPMVIADAEGRRLTPSVVHLRAGAEPIVGEQAKRGRAVSPEDTIYSVKRFIGRRGAEVPPQERSVMYSLNGAGNGPVTIPAHGREYTPEEISAAVLKKLKQDAETYFGFPVTRAVITVPAYFNDAQRNATVRAGELAGFNVERIVNEPTAAALAYGLGKLKDHSKIAVYDLGGGTFDLSILELEGGVFRVLATNGNTRLGGDDIDRAIMDHLIGKIGNNIRALKVRDIGSGPGDTLVQPRDSSVLMVLSRLSEAAEAAKRELSTENEVEIALPFLTPGYSLRCRLTRLELEVIARGVVDRTRPHCLRALADAKVEAQDLDQVILVGGQTRMPLVRRLVAQWFGCSEFEEARGDVRVGAAYHRPPGPQLNTTQNPDEAVALGAAIQAEILAGGFQEVLLLDVTPLSLGLETFGGLMNVIIPRNTTIPVKAGEMFTTAMDQQREMLIHVLQGEREKAGDNWSLGRFTIDFAPAARGAARVGVQFEIDANGILHVLARDVATGRQRVVQMKSAVDVDDAAVQRMVDESVEHAFEDLAARRWIEARLKAETLVSATRKGLADCADELDQDYRTQVAAALSTVDAALRIPDSGAHTGDIEELKQACAALDEVTRRMADVLMDRVTEAWTRGELGS